MGTRLYVVEAEGRERSHPHMAQFSFPRESRSAHALCTRWVPRFVCLFVCLFHGVPEVRGGRRLTKDGPYATRRQAEAVLFVRRKPTPPFAGCQGNLLFRGSRGLQTGRPVDHRPYSARHVGLKVESFWNNKPCAPRPPQMVWQILIRSTNGQLRHVQVRPCPVVGASRRCTCAVGPISRL